MKILFIALVFLVHTLAFAKTESKLVAFASDNGGYPSKALCYFSNNYMTPHPQGLLVLYTCLGGPDLNSEIWLVKETPVLVGVSAFGNLLSDPFVRGNDIYFFEYSEFETVGFSRFSANGLTKLPLPAEFKNSHVHDLALVGNDFYFRYTNHETQVTGEGIYTDEFKFLPARGIEFFWKPAANGKVMLQKTKLSAGEAVELRREDNALPVVIMKDRKADPASPFLVLRNQFALLGTQWATFAVTDSGLTLVRGNGATFTTEDLSALFKDIQYWTPALATDGEVIFRGTDKSGEFALWGYKNGVKRKIVGSGMEITEGTETLVTSSRSLLYNSPVFDSAGNLFIGVGLRAPESSVDLGQGVLQLKFSP